MDQDEQGGKAHLGGPKSAQRKPRKIVALPSGKLLVTKGITFFTEQERYYKQGLSWQLQTEQV